MKEKNIQATVVDIKSENFSSEIKKRFEKMYLKHSEKEIVVSFIVVISKNGNVTTHSGTLEGHDAFRRKLKEKEKEELKNQLLSMVEKV